MSTLTYATNETINALSARARRLAPVAAYEAADSGCTNTRPDGPWQAKAWDLTRLGLALNSFVDEADLAADFDHFVLTGERRVPEFEPDTAWEWRWIAADWHLACDLWLSLGLRPAQVRRLVDAYLADLHRQVGLHAGGYTHLDLY